MDDQILDLQHIIRDYTLGDYDRVVILEAIRDLQDLRSALEMKTKWSSVWKVKAKAHRLAYRNVGKLYKGIVSDLELKIDIARAAADAEVGKLHRNFMRALWLYQQTYSAPDRRDQQNCAHELEQMVIRYAKAIKEWKAA